MSVKDKRTISTKNNEHDQLVLIVMPYIITIDLMSISMVYLYKFKEFSDKTAIS